MGLFVFIWQLCSEEQPGQRGRSSRGNTRAAGQTHTQALLHFDVKPDPQISTNERTNLPRGVLLNCFILALCNSPQRALTLVCIQKVFACHLFHILPLQPYSTSQSYTQHPIMIKCKRLLGGWVNPEFFWV